MNEQALLAVAGAAGFVVALFLMLLLPVRRLRRALNEERRRLSQSQVEADGADQQLRQEREQWRKERQQLTEQLNRTEEELRERQRALARMEKQLVDLQQQTQVDHQSQQEVIAGLEAGLTRAKELVATADKRTEQQIERWKQEVKDLARERNKLQAQLTHFEHERKAEVAARVDEQRDSWERDNMGLRVQVSQLHADKTTLEQKLAKVLGTADQDRRNYEDALAAARTRADQEKQALEDEIGELMERLSRIQRKA